MSVKKVIIYTKSYCPYSKECKKHLDEIGLEYDEKTIDKDPAMETEMHHKADGRTDTPQIFISEKHVGSFDDLKALEASGKLDDYLKA